jgi:biofilm PGA synthesis N-glycosyltransferase PgaC
VALTYSIISPVRDEADNLPRLAHSLQRQTHLPQHWVIVESGSRDQTRAVAEAMSLESDWVRLLVLPEAGETERGAPIVRSIHAGLALLDEPPDVVVSVDADVTMDVDYFERLLAAFEHEPALGIASGTAWELSDEGWEQRFVTGGTVWGATRAYRWRCLMDVLPLEERHGWDGIDQLRARSRGWETRVLLSLPFRHHRREGARDGSRWEHWRVNGDTAHFMGYRPWYLLARTLHQMRRDPSAIALTVGYASAAARRSPRLDDPGARAVLRRDQSLGNIIRRRREALGIASSDPSAGLDDSTGRSPSQG